MDLSELLDVTEAVECEFLDHKITAHVYTAGTSRLTREERLVWERLQEQGEDDGILWTRALVPAMLQSWDLDGSPMTLRGEPFPPTAENMPRCPDLLLSSVGPKVMEFWNKLNPTNGDQPQTGLQAEETPESNPTQNTSP